MQAQMTLAELGRSYTQWSAEEARFNAILDRKMELRRATEKGERRGIKQGKEETKLELAQKMLAIGYEENEVAEITGLSPQKISALAKK